MHLWSPSSLIARPLESCFPEWSKCLCQSMHNCRLWPSWGFLFPPNALEEQINKVCVPVPWVTAIFMVTSLSRQLWNTVGCLTPEGVGRLEWTHCSLTQRQWNCSWLPQRHKASPTTWWFVFSSSPLPWHWWMEPQERTGEEGRGCCPWQGNDWCLCFLTLFKLRWGQD